MENPKSEKLNLYIRWLHHTMSAFGGFMAAYAILCYGNSGNAQTFNLIALTMALVGKNFGEFLLRIGGFLLYILGTLFFVVLDHHKAPVQWISIILNSILILLCVFVNFTRNKIIGLYPFFFAMSFQRNCFLGVNGFAAATIFSSNNTRQVALAIGDYYYTRDRKQIDRACFFFGALLFLNVGAALCAILFTSFGRNTILFSFIILAVASILIYMQDSLEHRAKEEKA